MRRRRSIYGNGYAPLSVMLPYELKNQLDEIADRKDIPTAQLVRTVLRGFIESRERVKQNTPASNRPPTPEAGAWPISRPRVTAGGAQ